MSGTSPSTPFATLQAAGIITAEQHRLALAHPSHDELSGTDSLADHLDWMLDHELIDDAALERAVAHVRATFTGAEQARYLAAIEESTGLAVDIDALHEACFRRLADAGWITQAECQRALAAIGPDETLVLGPGGLLAWMIGKGIIGPDRPATIRAAGNPGGDADKAAMLEDLEWMLGRPARQRRKWLYTGAGLLVAGVAAWMILAPASAPGCSGAGTRRTIEQLFLGASLEDRDARKPGQPISRPTVTSLGEVGYASAPRVRACKATVEQDGEQMHYAFTIAPAAEGKSGFVVTGAEAAIVEARFGNIDADGNYGNKAEPLGRAEVERAFRAGVEAANARFVGISPRAAGTPAFDVESAVRRKFGLSCDAAERAREIAEVEPVAPCRPVGADHAYRCRLLVERNDPLLAALGRDGNMVLDGDFTFERDGAAGQWRTTAALPGELAKAIVAARSKVVAR